MKNIKPNSATDVAFTPWTRLRVRSRCEHEIGRQHGVIPAGQARTRRQLTPACMRIQRLPLSSLPPMLRSCFGSPATSKTVSIHQPFTPTWCQLFLPRQHSAPSRVRVAAKPVWRALTQVYPACWASTNILQTCARVLGEGSPSKAGPERHEHQRAAIAILCDVSRCRLSHLCGFRFQPSAHAVPE
jgi:hypothetical protein